MPIHPTAQIDPAAELDATVEVGPFCVIGPRVRIGPRTRIGPLAHIAQDTVLGAGCVVAAQTSLGTDAQDLKYRGEPSQLVIGDEVIIRENVTVNRGSRAAGVTRIGDRCVLLAYSHVAHDCTVGEKVVLANGVQLGGFVTVEAHANIGGLVPVHQFCRVGRYSFIGGGFRAVQDVPPYVLAAGEPLRMYGLNVVGLRRAGFSAPTRRLIKKAYALLYRRKLPLTERLAELETWEDAESVCRFIIDFVRQSQRGIIPPVM